MTQNQKMGCTRISILVYLMCLLFPSYPALSAPLKFEEIRLELKDRDFVCFFATPYPGRFSSRFILDELNHHYGDKVLFVSMNTWLGRQRLKEMAVSKFPAYLLVDRQGYEIARLENPASTKKIALFFAKHLELEKPIFIYQAPGAFRDKNGYFNVYQVDRLLHIISGATPEVPPVVQKQVFLALKYLLESFKPYSRDYLSLAWLEDILKAELIFAKPTTRYNLKGRRIVSIVKIVPDLNTFYREIGNWNDEYIYPILLGDNRWSLKFIEAFQPESIIHVKATSERTKTEEALLRALANSSQKEEWPRNKTITAEAVNRIFSSKMDGEPLGVVVLGPNYACAPAGVALAAARYQLIYIRPSYGRFAEQLSFEKADFIRKDLMKFLKNQGVPFLGYGQDLDGITLAADMPFRYTADNPIVSGGLRAVDDLIDTKDSGAPWGVVGRLIGDETGSVYRAMCSIFLKPEEALFFSRYSTTSLPWKAYDPREAVKLFSRAMPTRAARGSEATLERWRQLNEFGNRAGFVFINSSGGANSWSVSGGQALPADIVHSVPSQVYIIHSGSAVQPLDKKSVMGRWFEVGAYNYFGSMAEPLLQAFVRPDSVTRDLFKGYPFALASRDRSGDFSFPWRLVFFGDPLAGLFLGAERISGKNIPSISIQNEGIFARPGFRPAYHGDWEGVLAITGDERTISTDSDVYNLRLVAYAKQGKTEALTHLLTAEYGHELWPLSQLLVSRLLLEKAYAAEVAEEQFRLLGLVWRISENSLVLEKLVESLFRIPEKDLLPGLETLLNQAVPSRQEAVLSVFTDIYLKEYGRSLDELNVFLEKFKEGLGRSDQSIQALADFVYEGYNQDPELATAIIKQLLTQAGPGLKKGLLVNHLAYSLGFRLDSRAAFVFEREKELLDSSDENISYYKMLFKIRASETEEAVEQIDAFLKQSPEGDLKQALEDEKRLLLGEKPKRKQLTVKLQERTPVKIDGVIEKEEWEAAVQFETQSLDESLKKSQKRAVLGLLLTKDKLYFKGVFHLEKGQTPLVRFSGRDSAVWTDESVELFIDHNRDYKTTHQVVFNAWGAIFDFLAFSRRWNGRIEVKTKMHPQYWVLEAALPVKDLFPGGLNRGDVLGLNVVYNSPGAKPARTLWSPCGPSNHNVPLYGYLIIK